MNRGVRLLGSDAITVGRGAHGLADVLNVGHGLIGLLDEIGFQMHERAAGPRQQAAEETESSQKKNRVVPNGVAVRSGEGKIIDGHLRIAAIAQHRLLLANVLVDLGGFEFAPGDLDLFFCHGGKCIASAGGNFGLQPEDIAVFDANVGQRLLIEELLACSAVVEFVAQRLAVRGELREFHLFQQYRQQAIDRRIVGHFHPLPSIAGGIPNFNCNQGH